MNLAILRKRITCPKPTVRIFNRQINISNWNESDIITDRKSRFQARHTDLYDANDITEILNQFLAEHKSIAKNATHPHILAWRTGESMKSSTEGINKGRVVSEKGGKSAKNERKIPSKTPGENVKLQLNKNLTAYSNVLQGFNDNGEKRCRR